MADRDRKKRRDKLLEFPDQSGAFVSTSPGSGTISKGGLSVDFRVGGGVGNERQERAPQAPPRHARKHMKDERPRKGPSILEEEDIPLPRPNPRRRTPGIKGPGKLY